MQGGVWSNIGRARGFASGALAIVLMLSACSADEQADKAAAPAQSRAAAEADSALAPVPVMGPERRIIAFGDSLFAGYGLNDGESYPDRLEAALRARGINAAVTNAGVSGDTTAAGRQRLAFTLDAQGAKPDLFILELGGNDLLRGLSPQETRANLAAMLDELKARGIPVLIMGMRAPPNYGPDYQDEFDAIYRDLAKQYGAALIPFWLEGIYQDQSLFLPDRIHPTAEGVEQLVSGTIAAVRAALPEDDKAA
ncbi:MAG: arylesterase [Porphyrobacter sp.]|jgi:acyl-CoA thioesterase-1|nr:arylesterase [Porphyrobacter sp.]